MRIKSSVVLAVVFLAVAAAGCQSDQERENIGRATGYGAAGGALL